MTVQDHLKIMRERWLAIVVCVLLGLGAAGAVYALQPSRYTASLQLYVSSQVPANSDAFLSASQLAKDRVKSYTALATSPPVLSQVIQRLDLRTTPDDLKGKLTASAVDEAVVIDLTATDGSAEQAATVANTVGDALRDTVEQLERPQGRGAIAPVAVRAVRPALVPTQQSSLALERLLAVGLLLGLAAGVAVAFARHAVDRSVKGSDQLAELVDAPSLGSVTQDGRVAKRPLLVQDDPQGRLAEDVRRLRTNLQFVDAGNPHKILTITSALPGEGKTTVSINLAAALGSAGGRVLLIDADLRRPRAADLLDVDRTVGLTSVLARRVPLADVIHTHHTGRFDVLPSGPLPPNPSELLASRQMRELLNGLRDRYDVILIDTSPLLPVTDAAALAPSTNGAVLVCRCRRTTRAQVRSAAEALRQVDVALRGSILTMVDRPSVKLPSYASTYKTDAAADVTPAPHRSQAVSEDQTTTTMSLNGSTGGAHHRPSTAPRATNGRHAPSQVGGRPAEDER